MKRIHTALAAGLAVLMSFYSGLAHAQSGDSLFVAGSASNTDTRLSVAYRHRFESGVQLGAVATGGFAWDAYIVGYAATDEALGALAIESRFPVLTRSRLRFHLAVDLGVRRIFGDDGQPTGSTGSWAVEARAGMLGQARMGRGAVRFGVWVPFSIEVAPEVVNDAQGALLSLGGSWPLSERARVFADFETGGLFGSNGDALKFLARGTVGVQLIFGTSTSEWWSR